MIKFVTKSEQARLTYEKKERMVKALDTEKLYRTYFTQVYSYVMNIVKNPAVAEGITQNTFMKTLTAKNGYKGASSEYTWLCAIAKNQCYDYFRKSGKVADGIEAEEQKTNDRDVSEDFIVRESSLSIHRILHDMEEPYKEVFELRVFGELSFAEIASIFGKTDSWARVTYHRARLKIKERLEDYE